MSELNDKELFESAISDQPEVKSEPETAKEEPKGDGQHRNEKGQFASKEAKPEPVAETQPEQPKAEKPEADKEAHVPSWRLREVNEAREAAERRAMQVENDLAELRRQMQSQAPKEEPVDFFTDPNAAFKQQLSPLESRLQTVTQNLTLRASRAEAVATYGKDAVKEMETAVENAMRERHPDMRLKTRASPASSISTKARGRRAKDQAITLSSTTG